MERSIRTHRQFFGFEPISAVVEDPIQKVSVVLLSSPLTNFPIEIITPLTDDSPILNLLKKGVRLYHFCFSSPNIEETLLEMRGKNALIVSKPKPSKLFDGRRVAFVHIPEGYIVELLEDEIIETEN